MLCPQPRYRGTECLEVVRLHTREVCGPCDFWVSEARKKLLALREGKDTGAAASAPPAKPKKEETMARAKAPEGTCPLCEAKGPLRETKHYKDRVCSRCVNRLAYEATKGNGGKPAKKGNGDSKAKAEAPTVQPPVKPYLSPCPTPDGQGPYLFMSWRLSEHVHISLRLTRGMTADEFAAVCSRALPQDATLEGVMA